MHIELSQLPKPLQQQILTATEPVQFVNQGQVVGHFIVHNSVHNNVHNTTANDTTDTTLTDTKPEPKSYANGDFAFDLERMKHMMDTEFKPMPKFASDEEFFAWVDA